MNITCCLAYSHVSGLNKTKAAAILKERDRLGGTFICREQLLQVKGLGNKSYEQCAGFIHVKYAITTLRICMKYLPALE